MSAANQRAIPMIITVIALRISIILSFTEL
jgi:hypothetical protein